MSFVPESRAARRPERRPAPCRAGRPPPSFPLDPRSFLLGALALALLPLTGFAQEPSLWTVDAGAERAMDRIFAEWDRDGSPGCAVGVYREGELVLARGYGEANLDWGIPIDPLTTVFYAGSVSKQFTAALAALLHLDGTIDLDRDVRSWIPELPAYDPPVTVRHLVHHTSGVRDIYGLISLSSGNTADVWTDERYLELLARQSTLNHSAGSDHLYSNGGYFLLTTLLERASGKRLDELARERIFGPLGMDDTHFHQDAGRIVARRAMSYGGSPGTGFRQTYLSNFDKAGAGGLYTTIPDLAAWDRNFVTGEVGGPPFLELIHTPGVLTSGQVLNYAFGLTTSGRTLGRPTVGHGGSFMGFRADFLRFPEEGLSLAALCNLGGINPGPLTRQMAGELLGPAPVTAEGGEGGGDVEAEVESAEVLPSLSLDALAGEYHSPEVDAVLRVRHAEGELWISGAGRTEETRLRPLTGDRFEAPGWRVDFRVESGTAAALVLDAGRVRNVTFERIAR